MELFVGEVEESAGFAELFLEGLVPDVFGFDVGGQTFSQKMNFMMEAFDEHSGVPLQFIKAPINCIKSAINCFEAAINSFEALIYPVKALIYPVKSFIKILNKFLIHTASVSESKLATIHCQ